MVSSQRHWAWGWVCEKSRKLSESGASKSKAWRQENVLQEKNHENQRIGKYGSICFEINWFKSYSTINSDVENQYTSILFVNC